MHDKAHENLHLLGRKAKEAAESRDSAIMEKVRHEIGMKSEEFLQIIHDEREMG